MVVSLIWEMNRQIKFLEFIFIFYLRGEGRGVDIRKNKKIFSKILFAEEPSHSQI